MIIVFSDKVLHVVLLEGTKENELVTCDSGRKKERKSLHQKMYSLQKNGLKKVLMDIDPRKEDRVIRVQFEKCLLCTFYQKEFILSSVRDVIRHARLI